jgi:hypothetical protein
MLLHIGIEVSARGCKPGRFALGGLMDVKGVLAGRKTLQVGFNRDSSAFLLAQNCGSNALTLSVIELHGHRFARGMKRRSEKTRNGYSNSLSNHVFPLHMKSSHDSMSQRQPFGAVSGTPAPAFADRPRLILWPSSFKRVREQRANSIAGYRTRIVVRILNCEVSRFFEIAGFHPDRCEGRRRTQRLRQIKQSLRG